MEIESSESLLSFDDDSEEYIESQNEIIQIKIKLCMKIILTKKKD